PITAKDVFTREEPAHLGMLEVFALPGPIGHNLQQRPKRRTRAFDAAIVEIHLCDVFLSGDDIVHTVGEDIHILQLRPEHLRCEDDARMVDHAAKERMDEPGVYPVTEPRRMNDFAAVLEISAFFEVTAFDEKRRVTFFWRHAAPDLGNEQADVMVHA